MPIQKKSDDKPATVGGHRVGATGFQAKFRQAQMHKEEKEVEEMGVMTNRIGLMLDLSGSMSSCVDYSSRDRKSKLDYLREAVESFFNSLNLSDSSVGAVTIPPDTNYELHETNQPLDLLLYVQKLTETIGGTPMGHGMATAMENISMTRGILISDGEPTDDSAYREQAYRYRDAEIPIDCVHIGKSQEGEEVLKEIAKITGGLYIKFDNVANFGKNFKYLAPAFRAMLTSGDAAGLLGAKEVK